MMVRQRGLSLIELVISIVVLSLGIAGISAVFMQTARHAHTPYLQQRALAVANAYMDEILHKRWNEGTPLGGGCVETGSGLCTAWCATRTAPDCASCNLAGGACTAPVAVASGADEADRPSYDDLDDYNGLSESPPRDVLGGAMSGAGAYSGFSAAISVTPPAADWNGIPASEVRRIRVAVTNPEGHVITISAYRTNF